MVRLWCGGQKAMRTWCSGGAAEFNFYSRSRQRLGFLSFLSELGFIFKVPDKKVSIIQVKEKETSFEPFF